ncbi:MAG: XRE family transcriptional regulator [Bacteroidetes bacterium]|nr:MAG: XRE family transcriptional regulator [Bacteroidota bacterium]
MPEHLPDWIDDLERAVAEHGQSEVARRMGCSPATVWQLRRRQYPASEEALARWRARFLDAFSAETVPCPVLGPIDRPTCAHHRSRPFAATNPLRVRLYQACRTCSFNPENPPEDPS